MTHGTPERILRKGDAEPGGKGGEPGGGLAGSINVNASALADPDEHVFPGEQVESEGTSACGRQGGVDLRRNREGSDLGHSRRDLIDPGRRNDRRGPNRAASRDGRHEAVRPNAGLETEGGGAHEGASCVHTVGRGPPRINRENGVDWLPRW